MHFLLAFLMACGGDGSGGGSDTDGTTADTDVDCETIPDFTCGHPAQTDTLTGDTGCPEGFSCWGPSAFVCYRGTECNLPICLPPLASIATPDGPRALTTLRVGDLVYSRDVRGARVVVPVVQLGSTRAPVGHEIVHVTLSDGRAVRGSPGHPTTDGRTLGDLAPGDLLDGASVRSAERVPYRFTRTFDLLPDGATGVYEADGIWLGSTLH